jgi:hypothetical protein
MPIIENKIELFASPKKVWKILNDVKLNPIWNITVREITEFGSDKRSVRSTIGDYSYIITDMKKNKWISYKTLDHPAFSEFGFKLEGKGDLTEVSEWINCEMDEHKENLGNSIDYLLASLKRYIEYLEEGGDDALYEKDQTLVI